LIVRPDVTISRSFTALCAGSGTRSIASIFLSYGFWNERDGDDVLALPGLERPFGDVVGRGRI
jgi:hypothetical protein